MTKQVSSFTPRRRAITPSELERVLLVLAPFGFQLNRIEFAATGAVILHGQPELAMQLDPLSEWEVRRASKTH